MKPILTLSIILFVITMHFSWGDIGKTINWHGVLTDIDGNRMTGEQKITFHIYDPNGSEYWQESITEVLKTDGFINVILGKTKPLNLPIDRELQLAITVDDDLMGLLWRQE